MGFVDVHFLRAIKSDQSESSKTTNHTLKRREKDAAQKSYCPKRGQADAQHWPQPGQI